jgi:FkbM family methyltransferase
MKQFVRITGWLNRFTVSVEQLGLLNTLRIFLHGRFTNKELRVTLPNGLPFIFRGKVDVGVISHSYKEGYFIEDNNSQCIETIVDAGANIGDETARFLFHYPNAEIIAIEAAECNFFVLQKNFADVKNIELVKGALWPVETHLRVVPGSSMQSFSVIETSDISHSVPAWTVSHLMRKMNWDKIDILKLDIEGSEYELFTRNYEEWIDKVNSFIFEGPDNDRPGSTQAIWRALEGRAYNSYICGENHVLIRAELPWKLNKVVGFNS